MFGYVKPYKPELRVRELEEYKAVYCGLCRELGRSYGPLARLTLSYDFAFAALLHMALEPQEPELRSRRCALHPTQRCPNCEHNKALEFSAGAAMVLFYYKLRDDMADRGFFRRLRAALIYPFAAGARRKAVRTALGAAELDEAAAAMMKEQAAVEAGRSPSADLAAEPTAKFLEHAFSLMSTEETQRRVLERLGYLLGRYIYLADAADDLEDDRKRGNYNPFLCAPDTADALERAKGSLFATTAEFAAALSLLDIKRSGPILENTARLGLTSEVRRITEKRSGKPE